MNKKTRAEVQLAIVPMRLIFRRDVASLLAKIQPRSHFRNSSQARKSTPKRVHSTRIKKCIIVTNMLDNPKIRQVRIMIMVKLVQIPMEAVQFSPNSSYRQVGHKISKMKMLWCARQLIVHQLALPSNRLHSNKGKKRQIRHLKLQFGHIKLLSYLQSRRKDLLFSRWSLTTTKKINRKNYVLMINYSQCHRKDKLAVKVDFG